MLNKQGVLDLIKQTLALPVVGPRELGALEALLEVLGFTPSPWDNTQAIATALVGDGYEAAKMQQHRDRHDNNFCPIGCLVCAEQEREIRQIQEREAYAYLRAEHGW